MVTCDTGEPLPPKLAQKIRDDHFVEVHEFLPKPLLDAASPRSVHSCACCHNSPQVRATRTVGDLWTWQLCFNRYVAAVAGVCPNRVPGMLAHANTVLQAAQQFEGDGWRVYDRAFRLQLASNPASDWSTINISLYARTFTAATRRTNVCRYCCSKEHASRVCPWGVDAPGSLPHTQQPLQPAPRQHQGTAPLCMSWNAGACRFPRSCRFRHACSLCGEAHPRTSCPQATPGQPTAKRRAPAWGPAAN